MFLNQKYNLGGSEYNFDLFNPEFNGFRQRELAINAVAKAGIEVQYNLLKNMYITPSFQYGKISDRFSPFNKDSNDMYGYGLNLGYESLLAPININVAKNNLVNFWGIYFSIYSNTLPAIRTKCSFHRSAAV
nr:hypothetical protein [Chryseobacterium angstadtii]